MKFATYPHGTLGIIYYRPCTDCGIALCQFIRFTCWCGGGYKLRNFRGPGATYCPRWRPPINDDIPF